MSRAIVIATKGRPVELSKCVEAVLRAGSSPDDIFVSAVESGDVAHLPSGVNVIFGPAGAALQRNRALDEVGTVDTVFFFDDDALVAPDYLALTEKAFHNHPEVVGLTGGVKYDGAVSGAISWSSGLEKLDAASRSTAPGLEVVRSLYGCNFAVRAKLLKNERFDENLPLYSWLEDLDLSRRLERHGELRRLQAAECVHLGSASGGRISHRRFGYSQIANAVYLRRKGSLGLTDVLRLTGRPLAANIFGTLRGDSPRRARLGGNVTALKDILLGRLSPDRITAF